MEGSVNSNLTREKTHCIMASTIEKALLGAGLALAGTATIYLYWHREQDGEKKSKLAVETPEGKTRVFPFTMKPGNDIKPGSEIEKAKVDDVPHEDHKQSQGVEDNSGSDRSMRSLIEDAKTVLQKTMDALHGEGEEENTLEEKEEELIIKVIKEEEVGLFSWFMGKQNAEEEGTDTEGKGSNEEKE